MRSFPSRGPDKNQANEMIGTALLDKEPFMIPRWGYTELNSYLAGRISQKSILYRRASFHLGITPDWLPLEPSQSVFEELHASSGVFPPTRQQFDEFCEIYEECHQNIDILGSWLRAEKFLTPKVQPTRISFNYLSPFVHLQDEPWTEALKGKRVLVIHSFEATMKMQLPKRHLIFGDRAAEILPPAEYSIIAPPQGYGGTKVIGFDSWTRALFHLKEKVSREKISMWHFWDVEHTGCR